MVMVGSISQPARLAVLHLSTRVLPLLTMPRFLSFAILVIAIQLPAAEPASAPLAPAAAPANGPATLAELEARVKPDAPGADYGATARPITEATLALIETNTLTTADEFLRASQLVSISDNRYRVERVRYELRLSASALGSTQAAKQVAAGWDQLLATLGRPLRTDFGGLVQKNPRYYQLDLAPASVLAVLRDPVQARTAAQDAQLNAEMKTIVDADQADRRVDFSKLTSEQRAAISARDEARNRRTQEIMKEGGLHTAADFANASLVMQHSAGFSGYQTAHELAVCAMLLGDRSLGRWLVAATYDRMLGSVGHDQRFGTQYGGMGGVSALVTVDPRGICDGERQALGCPTLEQAKNRNLNAKDAAAEKLLAEFTGPNRTIRDPKFGLSATMPEGWRLDMVMRWGDQQQTLHFGVADEPDSSPSFYYRVYRQPRARTPEQVLAHVRTEVEKKQASRREQTADYTNRRDSLTAYRVGEYAAFSWVADFTSSKGERCAEYFVRFETDDADASFFLQAPVGRLEALRPAVDQFMATVKMPKIKP
jgi:hypothetical protein